MSGLRRTTGSLLGFVAAVLVAASGNLSAQGPGSPQPPGGPQIPPPAPQPGGTPGQPPGSGNSVELSSIILAASGPTGQRFNFKIEPNTPVKDLLPPAPAVKPVKGPILTDDLAKVPEIQFQARPEKIPADGKLIEQMAHQLAKINHMNQKKTDAFMAALVESRPDLKGMPFAMGDDCRTSAERSKQFAIAVNTVRQALGGGAAAGGAGFNFNGQMGGAGFASGPGVQFLSPPGVGGPFWTQYAQLCEAADAVRPRPVKDLREHILVSRIAALMQMLAAESAELRLGLVKHLAGVPHVEATKALARLAIFSPEEDIRAAAIESLKVRREKDYTDVLVKGLRYPMPAVAKRAAEVITKTGRSDLLNELVSVLAEADPRMPVVKESDGKKVAVVREMVRVNHHHNCMMCHAPNDAAKPSASALVAEVPVPGQPLPSPSQGYGSSFPDLLVRIDVTYLRQDFSAMLAVSDAHPWPESQRFDFLVRERTLTEDEAADYRDQLTPKESAVLTPYHRAALAALRELTGKDAAPNAEAWRKLISTAAAKPDASGKSRD